MRKQMLWGAIAILAATLSGCQPYGYGYGNGYYGYNAYGPNAYGPYPNGAYGAYPNGAYGGYAPPAPAYAVPQPLSQASYNFVVNAALDEAYEIQAGTLAQQRGASRQIRQFAGEVVNGNSQLTQRMATVLQKNGTPVTIPESLDPQHQTMLNDLTAAQGPEFDRRYAIQQVVARQQAIAMLQNYAQTGDNPALRQFAQQTLPAAQAGLRLAQTLPGAAGAPPAQYSGLPATYAATCSKGVLWPFVREPGDCPTDAEKASSYSPYP